jgi:hypothetical protein
MDFEPSERSREFAGKLQAFLDERGYAAEPVYAQQSGRAGGRRSGRSGDRI